MSNWPTEEQVTEAVRRHNQNETFGEIAKSMNVCAYALSQLAKRRIDLISPRTRKKSSVENKTAAMTLRKSGWTIHQIAVYLKISVGTANALVKGIPKGKKK